MANLANLSNPRSTIKAFERAIRGVKKDAVKVLHKNAPKAVRMLAAMFETEHYADINRRRRRLGAISRQWKKRKAQLGLDSRRGHFTGTMARAIRNPAAIHRDRKGFTFDILRVKVNAKVKGQRKGAGRRRRKPRATPVNKYAKFYAQAKAPGLGTLPKSAMALLRREVRKKTAENLKQIRKQAQKRGSKFALRVELKIGKLNL